MDPQVKRRPLPVRTVTETTASTGDGFQGRNPGALSRARTFADASSGPGSVGDGTPDGCDYPGRRAWPEDPPPSYFDDPTRPNGRQRGGQDSPGSAHEEPPPGYFDDPRRQQQQYHSESRRGGVGPARHDDQRMHHHDMRGTGRSGRNDGPSNGHGNGSHGGLVGRNIRPADQGARRGSDKREAPGYFSTTDVRRTQSPGLSDNRRHNNLAGDGPAPIDTGNTRAWADSSRPGSSRSHRGDHVGRGGEDPRAFDNYRPRTAVSRTGTNLSLMPPSPSHYPPPSPLSPTSPMSPLRYARSATNLQAKHDRPSTAVADPRGTMPVDFVIDDLPTPSALGGLSPQSTGPYDDGRRQLRRAQSSSALSMAGNSANNSEPPPPLPLSIGDGSATSSPTTAAQKWKAALGEAQYFAGGLVSHPAESTRHYSIIRHSHALVWYRGPSTSISITVLSDVDMPPAGQRSVWLQQKGYSGGMGMSIKALVGGTGNWIDVTPATRATPADLPPVDERGIQRDLKRFTKRASGRAKRHVARETLVVRIPAAAVDGYFRLVVCVGTDEDARRKSSLCGSPVFRVASTTTDVSVTRGASLSTMPLEVGVKVASTVGQQVAKRYAGAATLVVQNRATSAVTKTVSKKALANINRGVAAGRQVAETTGADKAVTDSWNRKRGNAGRYAAAVFEETGAGAVSVIGPDEGPEPPFPVTFDGKVARASGRSTKELGIPTANIREVRDEVKMRMRGVFAAWACVVPKKGLENISHDWHEAIVTIGPLRYAPPEVVVKNRIAVHFIHDFDEDRDDDEDGETTFFDARVKVVLMGHLHVPMARDAEAEEVMQQHAADSMTVLASLARDNWGAEDTVTRMRSDKTFSDRLDGVTGSVQGRVDRTPLHWVGVRSDVGAMRDAAYGNGGLWIPR